MKKLFYCIAALATALFAASCAKENLEPVAQNSRVTYTIEVPGAAATKVIGEKDADIAMVNQLVYEVYRTEAQAADEYTAPETLLYHETAQMIDGKSIIELELVNDQNYRVLFWAQCEGNGVYTVDNLKAVSVNPTKANAENYAAFAGSDFIKDGEELVGRKVTLVRPVSQINIATTPESLTLGTGDQTTVTFASSAVTVKSLAAKGISNTYNVATAEPGELNAEYTFSATDPDNLSESTIRVGTKDYNYVAMSYVGFAPATGANVEVSYTIVTGNVGTIKNTVPNVPLKPNYRTNIIGNLITSESDYEVVLDREWSTPDENVYVWNGSEISAPAYDDATKTYTVVKASELAWVAEQVNSGDTFKGKTFKLTRDIDLNNHLWTPIAASGVFEGTFEGAALVKAADSYPVIKNLRVKTEGNASAGLFASCRGTIKNINLENVNIEGHYKTGALVGDGMCAKIENCHVDGAVILSTPHNNDDANHVGGIVGYLSAEPAAYVKNSSVKNATITGYRDVAGIAGTANGASVVTGNYVENVTVTADLTAKYVDNTKAANAAAVAGRVHADATVTPNTIGEGVEVIVKVDSTAELDKAIQGGHSVIYVSGEVSMPASAKGKALTINGIDNTAVIKVASPAGGERLDGNLEGSTVEFNKVTIVTSSIDPGYCNGYVRPASLTFNECTFNGTYCTVNGNPHIFNKCTFNVEGDKYNVWTWGSKEPVFTDCVFNCDGKAVLLYGQENTKLTMNNCVFNDNGDDTVTGKAAIEIGNDYDKSYTLIVNKAKVNGFSINPNGIQTGTTLWANKNSMPVDKLTVVIDGNTWNGTGYAGADGNIAVANNESLVAAVATENATVNVISGTYTFPASDIAAGVTLKCAEGTVFTGQSSLDVKGATVEGATFSNAGGSAVRGTINGTFKNCTFEGSNALRYAYAGETTVFENCVFSGDVYGAHFDGGKDNEITFKNCTFSGFNAFGSDIELVTFEGCTFKANGKSSYNGANLWGSTKMINTKFEFEGKASTEWVDCISADKTYEFTGCTLNGGTILSTRNIFSRSEDTDITIDGILYEDYAKTTYLASAKDMFCFANEVNVEKNAFTGKTVKLSADIDLKNAAWTPIGQTGATTFNGIFDGQNYTISNLNIDSESQTGTYYSSGLFGWVESHNADHGHIKNVKIAGAIVNGHHNCGALVGYITQQTALVENCHVTNASISCTYANGDADGDKAGALIGNATVATPVKNCTASNSTISAGRDAGQVIGAGKEANVTGCSATEVTVKANGTGTGNNVRNEIIGRLLN